MNLLTFSQFDNEIIVGLFESQGDVAEFVSQIPGYSKSEEDGFIDESIDPSKLPEYMELEYRGHLIPISKFSFQEDEEIYVDYYELPILSKQGHGLIEGMTKVDAYQIDNYQVKEYIQKREEKYAYVKKLLSQKGLEVSRSFQGSEDGEAIIYKDHSSSDWHFLTHMDPDFVYRDISDAEILEYLES